MHWCLDETLALLSLFPVIGYCYIKIKAWFFKKINERISVSSSKNS